MDKKLEKKLEDYGRQGKDADGKLLEELIPVLEELATTGVSSYPWPSVRALLVGQLQKVMDAYTAAEKTKIPELDGESFETRYERVLKYLIQFPKPPFTAQRMAELLSQPKRFYISGAKFFLAFSKLVCGISARNFEEENKDYVAGEHSRDMFSFFPMGSEASGSGFSSPMFSMTDVPADSLALFERKVQKQQQTAAGGDVKKVDLKGALGMTAGAAGSSKPSDVKDSAAKPEGAASSASSLTGTAVSGSAPSSRPEKTVQSAQGDDGSAMDTGE